MMNLEKELSIELNDIADVDGHDMGCGEINIFILATNPTAVFEASKPILDRFKLLHDVKAGYRLLSDDIYTTIWPDGSTDEFWSRSWQPGKFGGCNRPEADDE